MRRQVASVLAPSSLGLFALLALLSLVACKGDRAGRTTKTDPEPVVATSAPPPADPCAHAKPEGPLAWFHDDYASALACARQRGVPLVLDLWAPWCHTCLSMQSTVLTDPSFAADAGRFVFAALDTDREVNAPIVDKFALSAWPTFYVIGPDEAVLARFIGAASVPQFHAFLDAGAQAGTGGAAGADAHLLAAERALAKQDLATAETELVAALAAAPKDWPRRPDALVSLIGTLNTRGDVGGCLELASKAMDDTGNAASASDFLYHATACASDANKGDAALAAPVRQLRERAVARWRKLVADPAAPLSVDDRSDAMANLRTTLIALGRRDEGKAVAEQQRKLLDAAAAEATTPMAAMTFNWPRAEVYAFLERPLDLVPALERSAADLPREYDPPARLGWIYLEAGKLAEAAKWTDQAIRLAYGPRKIRVLSQRAEIARKQGDAAAERLFREEIVKTYEALPPGQASPAALAKAKQAVADLAAAGAGSATPAAGSATPAKP